MSFIQSNTMIVKIAVIFCTFQVALGQEVILRDIRDLIDRTEQEINDYILPLEARIHAFSNGVLEEARRLDTERQLLSQEILNLASLLNTNNADITDCVRTSLGDINRIFADREEALAAFNRIGFSSFNEVYTDLGYVAEEERNLVRETEDNIEACNVVDDLEAASTCYNEVFQLFDLMKNDILYRIMQLYDLGRVALANAERTQMDFVDGNRLFLRASAHLTRQLLTTCVEGL